jgi:membrane-associated phospholipid phosphatase
MRRCCGLIAVLILGTSAQAHAAESDGIRVAGEILRIALPAAAAGVSLGKDDEHGLVQLGASELLAEGSSLLLQEVIEEERPDKSDWHSFPSDSAAVAFSAAAFLQIRYGWSYGLPAYAVAGFVGWSRVESSRHYWHDVLAGAALGWVASEITAIRYHNDPGTIGASVPMSAAVAHGPLRFSFAARW